MHYSLIYFLKGNVYKGIRIYWTLRLLFWKVFLFYNVRNKTFFLHLIQKRKKMFPRKNSICSKFQNYLLTFQLISMFRINLQYLPVEGYHQFWRQSLTHHKVKLFILNINHFLKEYWFRDSSIQMFPFNMCNNFI